MARQNARSRILLTVLLVAAGSLGTALTGPLLAEIPRMINYQGLVVDKETGEPLPGEHQLIFRICDAPSGGSVLWSEEQDVTADTTGVVSVLVGSEEKIDISFETDCWLEVEVDGEVLVPRRELVSTPYAFKALNSDSLGGMGPGEFATAAHTHDDRYYTESELNTAGTINNASNPLDWTKIKGVPAGLADGADDVGPGDGYSLDASDGNPVDAVYVDQDGDVGIGTTSPARRLHIVGDGPRVLIEGTSGNSEVNFKSAGDPTAQIWAIYKESGSDDLRFYQNGDRVTIDSGTGNVGIGTTSPTLAKLQVQGSAIDGIYAKSDSGKTAVFAVAGAAVGGELDAAVVATSTKTTALAAHSTGGAAVYGTASRATVPAIHGHHSGDGPAIYGSGGGAYPAIQASRDGEGNAIAGYAEEGRGVYGYASSIYGTPVAGVQSANPTFYGSYWKPGGYFAGRNGILAYTETSGGYGVAGHANSSGAWAGRFRNEVGGGVYVITPVGETGLLVSGGSKSAAVATADGARLLYCEEASEVWFSDYGFGKLDGGVARVPIDPVFAQTVNLNESYHVFVQAYGDADLYVSARRADGFEVRLRGGDPTAEFSYRVVARRLGFEKNRLARAPWADNDPSLFPDKGTRLQGDD